MSRRRHPINIWPAFADLMTVLTIIGLFAALGLLRQPSAEELAERNRVLEKQNDELENNRDHLERQFAALREESQTIRMHRARLEARMTLLKEDLRKARRGRGEDPPPCLLLPGSNINPLYTIIITDTGLRVQGSWSPELSNQIKDIQGAEQLAEAGEVSVSTFRELAKPVYDYSQDPQNTFGERCIFYARIEIDTDSKESFGRYYGNIIDFFFPSNSSAVASFLKN